MKRLLVAVVAAVAFSTAFAKVTETQLFEDNSYTNVFVAAGQDEDSSAIVPYDNDKPGVGVAQPYPCDDDFGDAYLSLDTGSDALWCTNTVEGNVYFDMAMQFNPSKTAPDVETGTKVALYMNSDSNLVVVAGDGTENRVKTEYPVTGTTLAPGTWGRLTLSAVNDGGLVFKVYLNGTQLYSGATGAFQCLTADTTVSQFGLSGSGAIDDFVVRTTDPFLNSTVKIGGEYYASVDAALADDPTATVEITADAVTSKVLANAGDSISVKLNGHALTGLTAAGSLVPVPSVSGDVTTYTASYFPRTATAGQAGTAANPYEIADADDLLALQAAVIADASWRSLCYKQTADIDMTGVGGFWGIGWFTSSDSKDASITASGSIPFQGAYDGQGYTISNVSIVRHNYAGIFNCIEAATIKDLTVSNVTFSGSCSEEGFAVVGNAYTGSTIANVTSAGTWPAELRHNAAGIVVRAQGNTTISGCVNNVAISASNKRLGGILAFAGTAGTVSIQNCTNNAALVSTDGIRGVGGILGSPEAGAGATAVVISGCADFGSETAGESGYTGAIVGSLWSSTHTYTDDGGNIFPAASDVCGYFNGKTVYGLAYAIASTIDAVDYLTTVKQSDLAAGNTYVLLADVAASETPVYTFDAAGTISFNTNGYNFAGTVAVDRSTLMPATSETVGAVVTFTAAAGVASVDGTAYATFDAAVAALEGETEDDFVTLLADVTTTLSAGTTLKVKLNGKQLIANKGSDDLVIGYNTVDGVTTYTATEGVAAVKDGNELPWVWYATFEEAYAAAAKTTYYPDLKVKVGGDFVLPNVSRTINDFRTIEFIATTENPIDISLANANYYMASTRYTFPANATLHIVSGSLDSISGGTLDVPAGVTVLVNGYNVLNNISGLTGTGTLKLRDYTYESTGYTDVYYLTGTYNQKFNQLLRNANWQGTLELSGINAWDDWSLADIGNSGSTIRFNGLTTYLSGQYSQAVGTIELVGDGLTINGAKSGYTLFSIPSALKGNGALAVTTSGSQTTARFEGDVSGFTGDVTATGTGRIAFGSDQAGNAPVIYVHTGASVTNAATATWTCANFVVLGELVANGTVSATNPLYGNTTTGIYRANSTAAAITAAGTWQGTYVVGWNPSENGDTPFYINNYGSHANATIQIEGDENGVFKCYPRGSETYAPNVTAKIVLNANWTTGNGFSGDANATTFASLSGPGDFTVAYSGTSPIVYNITKLDGYTGTLGGKNGKFVIGKVNVATQPAEGARVVKTNIGTYGSISDNVPLYVAGVDTGKTLKYDASGAQGAGLYYIVPVVPVARIEGGDSYPTLGAAVAAAADGDVITLLDDLELDARVEPNLGANTTLAFNLGGFTLSRVGTSDNGSVIDVKSGNVVITNGVIDCTQDDTAIVADGVYALTVRSGSTLTLDDIEITVDSQAGACVYPFAGATVTINGGTYRNNTAEEYQYKTGWTGMAVNQANVATQLITIYGGSFKQVNPALGDDSWAEGEGTFLASGKAATWNSSTGYWDVGDAATPVEPGQKDSTKYNTAEAATNALATVTIAIPSAVDSALDAGQKADYVAMFEKKVVDNGDGTYSVAVEMKDEVVAEVQEDVDDAMSDTLTEVLKVAAGASTDVTVATKPGLYYAIVVGNSLPLAAPASSDYVMATADSMDISVTKPAGNAAFFKVYCSETK